MTRFEYLSVLVSIVIALGMSEVVAAWGRLLRRRREVRLCGIHAAWSLFALILMAQMWWGFWSYRIVEDWTFLGLLMVIADALLMVLAALVITPSDRVEPGLDLHEFFFASRRLFFGLGTLLLVQLAASDAIVASQPWLHPENGVRLAGIGLVAIAARSDNVKLHRAIVAIGFVLLAGFIATGFEA
jgi:hypothetical protein